MRHDPSTQLSNLQGNLLMPPIIGSNSPGFPRPQQVSVPVQMYAETQDANGAMADSKCYATSDGYTAEKEDGAQDEKPSSDTAPSDQEA